MIVVQCWDDGVKTDVRLVDMLRRHGAKATFNRNAGLHDRHRQFGWIHGGNEVSRLGWDEMKKVYQGFTIANHTLTHPRLELMERAAAWCEIAEGRDRLQQFFGQAVSGFAYPFGTCNEAIIQMVRDSGHVYARTTASVSHPFPRTMPCFFIPVAIFSRQTFGRVMRWRSRSGFSTSGDTPTR